MTQAIATALIGLLGFAGVVLAAFHRGRRSAKQEAKAKAASAQERAQKAMREAEGMSDEDLADAISGRMFSSNRWRL